MSTTMLPQTPPPPAARSASVARRSVTVRANLMPQEIVAKRRLRDLKRSLLIALAALLVLLIGWYGVTVLQTTSAQSNISSAQHETITLQKTEQQFGPLVQAQSQAASIKAELIKLMAGDLQWKQLLATLRKSATGGVTVSSVSASVSAGGTGAVAPVGASGTAGLSVLNQSGLAQIGTLTITGTAPDKNAVAAYIDSLTKDTGLAAPFPASVTGSKSGVTFTANALITSGALGGKYAVKPAGGH